MLKKFYYFRLYLPRGRVSYYMVKCGSEREFLTKLVNWNTLSDEWFYGPVSLK